MKHYVQLKHFLVRSKPSFLNHVHSNGCIPHKCVSLSPFYIHFSFSFSTMPPQIIPVVAKRIDTTYCSYCACIHIRFTETLGESMLPSSW